MNMMMKLSSLVTVLLALPLGARAETDPAVGSQAPEAGESQTAVNPEEGLVQPEAEHEDGNELSRLPRVIFPEDRWKPDAKRADKWRVRSHGYARMPLRTAGEYLVEREPYLIDDHYTESGFAYLRINETEWAETVVSVERGMARFVLGIQASEFSDWSEEEPQLSVPSNAFVETMSVTSGFSIRTRVGMFWERMGYLKPYDTYAFGRTHIAGVSVRTRLFEDPNDKSALYLNLGYGAHRRTATRGHTPLVWGVLGWDKGFLDVGLFGIKTWTGDNDDEFNASFVTGHLTITGLQTRLMIPRVGPLQFLYAFYEAERIEFIGESIELLHSMGGNGLRQNFLGNEDNGTGEVQVTGLDFQWQFKRMGLEIEDDDYRGMFNLLNLRVFAMTTWVATADEPESEFAIDQNDRFYFKWGSELYIGQTGPKREGPFFATRYDRVVLDADHESLSFRALSTRLGVTPVKGLDIFAQWAHYAYGDNLQPRREVLVRTGDDTRPDSDVFKIQAQVDW